VASIVAWYDRADLISASTGKIGTEGFEGLHEDAIVGNRTRTYSVSTVVHRNQVSRRKVVNHWGYIPYA
jgi:hypothetical protein